MHTLYNIKDILTNEKICINSTSVYENIFCTLNLIYSI